MDVQVLTDRLQIDDLLTTYTRAIDTGDWDRLDAVFTPDAEIDYTSTGGIAGRYPEVKAWLAENLPVFPRGALPPRPGAHRGRLAQHPVGRGAVLEAGAVTYRFGEPGRRGLAACSMIESWHAATARTRGAARSWWASARWSS